MGGRTGMSVANQWHLSLTDSQPSATIQMRFPSKAMVSVREPIEGYWKSRRHIDSKQIEISLVHSRHLLTFRRKNSFLWIDPTTLWPWSGTLYSNKVIRSRTNLWVQSNTSLYHRIGIIHQGMLRHESNETKWDIPACRFPSKTTG